MSDEEAIYSPEGLRRLTRRRSHACQKRELKAMGITWRERLDGSLVVVRSHVEGNQAGESMRKAKDVGPDWNAVRT